MKTDDLPCTIVQSVSQSLSGVLLSCSTLACSPSLHPIHLAVWAISCPSREEAASNAVAGPAARLVDFVIKSSQYLVGLREICCSLLKHSPLRSMEADDGPGKKRRRGKSRAVCGILYYVPDRRQCTKMIRGRAWREEKHNGQSRSGS